MDNQKAEDSFPIPHQALIGAHWLDADDGRMIRVDDPASGREVGTVPLMGAAETRRAIEAARAAQAPWAARPAVERADILLRWYALVLRHADDLAGLLTSEQGKPLAEAKGEIAYAAAFIRFFAEEARRIYGEIIPASRADTRILVMKQAIGVVGCITPWNFPAAMVTRKTAPALAAGCAVVLKPAESTPLTALALAGLARQADLPPGVLNVVTGEPAAIGLELCENPVVRKISFTGSTATGRRIAAQSAATIKKLSLELGGNAPFIVFDDADLDAAIEGAIYTKFRHSGQTCVCTNRFLIQAGIYHAFAQRFVERVSRLKVGPGMEPGVDIGALINENAIAKIEAHVADAQAKGAAILIGGRRTGEQGCFFAPTVLGGVTADMVTAREEIFGPVASLMRFETEAEALSLANDTPYGLAGYFYSRDLSRAWRVAEALECGMVGVNTGILSNETTPFGGIKQSGEGREGSHHGIDAFLQLKLVCLGGMTSNFGDSNFGDSTIN